MSTVHLDMELERAEATYRPGEPIRGHVRLEVADALVSPRGLQLRLAWRTSGKGDDEEGEAETRVLAPGPFQTGEAVVLPFELPCPPGPFTVSREYVSVEWKLEVTLEVPWGLDPMRRQVIRVEPGPCEAPDLGAGGKDPLDEAPGFEVPAAESGWLQFLPLVGPVALAAAFISPWTLNEAGLSWLPRVWVSGRNRGRPQVREAARVLAPAVEEELEARAGERVSLPVRMEVPTTPSFRGKRNQLAWSLLVRIQSDDGTEVRYRVPVVVRPPRTAAAAARGSKRTG